MRVNVNGGKAAEEVKSYSGGTETRVKGKEKKKDPTGIEPVTQGTAVPCSTAELRILSNEESRRST